MDFTNIALLGRDDLQRLSQSLNVRNKPARKKARIASRSPIRILSASRLVFSGAGL